MGAGRPGGGAGAGRLARAPCGRHDRRRRRALRQRDRRALRRGGARGDREAREPRRPFRPHGRRRLRARSRGRPQPTADRPLRRRRRRARSDARPSRGRACDAVDRNPRRRTKRGGSSSRTTRFSDCSPSDLRAPPCFRRSAVVIATGGVGGLYADSTNPPGSFGQGLALAARAGAVLADMEFVQFHPTALDGARRPMPLVSEAVRGEGAILVDGAGERFMAGIPGAELAPRDVVARAIAARRAEGRRVFLDARAAIGARFDGALSGHRGGLPRSRRRSGARADPGAAGAALSHGRDRRGRRGAKFDRRPLGVRRGGLHRPPRRQSACEQFADRSRRLRLDRRPLDRGRVFAPARASARRACAPCARSGAGAPDPVAGGRRHP